MAEVTHKMVLSTTEANNVGLIKVRKADDQTQVFDVQIIENGLPKSFSGLTAFFCLMAREVTGQGVSEEPVEIFSGINGTLKHTLSANAFQMIGRNEAYFSFRKELSNGKWAEQFSTRSFFYTVEKSIYTEPFKDSNYWWTFKELYRILNEYVEGGKKSWEDFYQNGKESWQDFVDSNREILEAIDPGGAILNNIYDLTEKEKENKNYLARTGFFKYMQDKTPLVAGHRGNFYLAPENTIPSYILGARDFDLIECDISLTLDQKWVVMHDDTVDRMTDGTGTVASFTHDQFMNLNIDAGNKIEFFPGLKPCDLNGFLGVLKEYNCKGLIEIKNGTYTDQNIQDLLNAVYLKGLNEKVIIITRKVELLQRIRAMDSSVALMVVGSNYVEATIEICKEYGIGLDYDFSVYTAENIAAIRQYQLPLAAWTIENHLDFESMKKMGIDIIATNSVI